MTLKVLHPDRWPELTDVFRETFDCFLPQPSSVILAEEDENGKVTKFVVLEVLFKLGQIYNSGNQSRAMLDFFNNDMEPGNSVIAMPCEERMEGLCEKFGMLKVDCTSVWRKDF